MPNLTNRKNSYMVSLYSRRNKNERGIFVLRMKRKCLFPLLALILLFILPVSALAHPGGTDVNGGHYEDGEYHYHHGYPAHQHEGGVCPYASNDLSGSGEAVGNNDSPSAERFPISGANSALKSSASPSAVKVSLNDNRPATSKDIAESIIALVLLLIIVIYFIARLILPFASKHLKERRLK